MRYILLLFTLQILNFSFCQNVSDLGSMTFEQVKNQNRTIPCETTGREALRYCSEDGNYIIYTFYNNRLNGIIFLTAFLTRSQAERELVKLVDEFSQVVGKKPLYNQGKAIFSMTHRIGVTYEVQYFEGTYFIVYSTLLTN
jgi:hypothetical protein